MQRSETTSEISPDWVAALNQLSTVEKDGNANYGRYATIGAVLAAVKPVLAAHNLAVSQEVVHGSNANGPTIGVATTVTHISGEWFATDGTQNPSGIKSGPQDNGSAITYARRYDLQTFLGLATEDDDGQRAQNVHQAEPEPHPNADRVANVLHQFKHMTDTQKEALKVWADGRHLSGGSMIRNEAWLETVEAWLREQEVA